MKSNYMKNDCMSYQPGMEIIGTDILETALAKGAAYDPGAYTADDALAALSKNTLDTDDLGALLSPAAGGVLREMVSRAARETARYFGNTVRMFTPLYIANYCVNHCVYCGFNCKNKILRGKLTEDEIARELEAIAATGLDEVLILTGESRKASDVEYIGKAVSMAAGIFGNVGIEIYPLNTDEYLHLRQCGADFVSVYQETYDPELYEQVHPSGPKRCFPYRFNAQERALRAGMRGAGFGALLGLGEFRRDAYTAGLHVYLLQKKYPQAELSFSVPRIRAFQNSPGGGEHSVGEKQLLQIMLAYRIFMPFAGMTISTRERGAFRDAVTGVCATKISAGVCVGVGGHEAEQKGGEQFVISDPRSVDEIHEALKVKGLQPVYTDHIRV